MYLSIKSVFTNMRLKQSSLVVLLAMALSVFGLSACVSTLDGETYRRGEARRVQAVSYATVLSTRPVVIEGTNSGIGAAAGGVVGGVAGSSVGDGTGSVIGAAIGAVVGGIAGAVVEEEGTKTQGIELTLRKDDGTVIAVVQEANENDFFPPNSRVQLVRNNGTLRAFSVPPNQAYAQ